MALYEFECVEGVCGTNTVRYPMSTGPTAPDCYHGPMRRVYAGGQKAIVMEDMRSYIDKAYRGEELPPGMTQPQVRAIVDAQVRRNHAGRGNARQYKTAR